MRLRVAAGLAVLAALATPLWAQKIPPDFRSAFEGRVQRHRTFAVVAQGGLPTTSIYGVDGKQTDAYYSVDIKGGQWQASTGLLDFNQVAVDGLGRGEIMEVVDVSFKDNRIDLRMVSVEAHRVSRGSGFGQTSKREPVATNFKFFFPFAIGSARDLPRAMAYIENWVRLLPSEEEARRLSARILTGDGGRKAAAPPSTNSAASGSRTEIKPGMTALEVIEVLGKPQKEVTFENRSRWTYPDITVIFENGRVKEVRF
jgi:hypothetical protein